MGLVQGIRRSKARERWAIAVDNVAQTQYEDWNRGNTSAVLSNASTVDGGSNSMAMNVLQEKDTLSPQRVLLLGASLIGIGVVGFYCLPGMIASDASGSRLVNAIYCSTVTLTTIGYGDICPGELEPISKVFLVFFATSGLGFFCGPCLEFASTWTHLVPGGFFTISSVTVGIGVALFTKLEGISQAEAVYASVITGTTIGYGDFTPSSDFGKVAIAAYAVLVVNVIAGLLEPGRCYLENLCRVRSVSQPAKSSSTQRTATKQSMLLKEL